MTSKRAKQLRDAEYRELARNMETVGSVLETLLPDFRQGAPPMTRTHHLGPFSGAPDDFDVVFIFATRAEASEAAASGLRDAAAAKVVAMLRSRDYPSDALKTFKFDVASEEEIVEGGGDFYHWR